MLELELITNVTYVTHRVTQKVTIQKEVIQVSTYKNDIKVQYLYNTLTSIWVQAKKTGFFLPRVAAFSFFITKHWSKYTIALPPPLSTKPMYI